MILEFGIIFITKGRKHDFLGKSICINDNKTVNVDMSKKLEEIIEYF